MYRFETILNETQTHITYVSECRHYLLVENKSNGKCELYLGKHEDNYSKLKRNAFQDKKKAIDWLNFNGESLISDLKFGQ